MKKVLSAFLALSLIFAFAACGGGDIPSETPAPSPASTPEPSPEPTPEPVYDDSLIGELYSLDGVYTDELGNEYNYSFHVPAIYENTDGAKEINAEIASEVAGAVVSELENMNFGISLICYGVRWEAHWHGSVASIVVTMDTDFGYTDYWTGAYDFATGKKISNKELLALSGAASDETWFYERACAAVKAEFEKTGSWAMESDPAIYDELMERSVSPLRVNTDMKMYWDENGDIMLIADIASFAGAESYYHIVPLD